MKMQSGTSPENLTEALVKASGCQHLTRDEIVKQLVGFTVSGTYLHGFRFRSYIDPDGTMEGKNNAGAHNFGRWSTDKDEHTFTVQWQNGWDHTCTRAYNIDGVIHFFDIATGDWRNMMHEFQAGRQSLEV